MKQCARAQVANKADKISSRRIKNAEAGRRITLRVWRIGKTADGFKAYHRRDLVAALFATAGVNETPHLGRLEIRRLLISPRDEASRLQCRSFGKTAPER